MILKKKQVFREFQQWFMITVDAPWIYTESINFVQNLSYHGRKENLCVRYQCILPEAFLSREKLEKFHHLLLGSRKVKSITLPETARLPLEK